MKPARPAASIGKPGMTERIARGDALDAGSGTGQRVRGADERPGDEDRGQAQARADPIQQRARRHLPAHHPEVEGDGDVAVLRVRPLELRAELGGQHRQHLPVEQVDRDRRRQQADDRPAGLRGECRVGLRGGHRSAAWPQALRSVHCRPLSRAAPIAGSRRAPAARPARRRSSGGNPRRATGSRETAPSAAMKVCSYPMMWPGLQKLPKIGCFMSVTSRSRRPCSVDGLGRVEELEVVEPLQVEPEHAAGRVHLERVLVLAPDAEPRRFERAGAAVRELDDRHDGVVHGPVRGEGARDRHGPGHRPVEIQRRIEQVREQVVRDARAGQGRDPFSSSAAGTCPRPIAACTRRCSERRGRAVLRQSTDGRRQSPGPGGS